MRSSDRLLHPFTVALGGESGRAWDTGLPVLFGEAVEALFSLGSPCLQGNRFSLYRSGEFLLGVGVAEREDHLEDEAFQLYDEMLSHTGEHGPCRIWNYVPAINEINSLGLENYRAFCRGRSLAFESRLGADFPRRLPSASAVGTTSSHLMVVFVGSNRSPHHVENPLQLPAYRYPDSYGPRSPSFARASVLPGTAGRRHVFISGTSAIRGHHSVHPDDFQNQLSCTLENLTALGHPCGLGDDLSAGNCRSRHVRVYLRREQDLDPAMERLNQEFLHPGDHVSVLRSDICRRELLVEIEMTVLDARHSDSSRPA